MKTKLTLLTTFTLFIIHFANAQVNVNVNINTLPEWAPEQHVPETRYYYIPEIEVYYDIPSKMYIYPHKKGWVRNKKLPKHYSKHNLNKCYKVALYDIGPNPYAYHNSHKNKYPKNYKKGKHQPTRTENKPISRINNKQHNANNTGFQNREDIKEIRAFNKKVEDKHNTRAFNKVEQPNTKDNRAFRQ